MSKVADVSPELLKAIREEFNRELKSNKRIDVLYDKVKAGTASYEEADDFAVEVGNILAHAFQNNLSAEVLPNGKMYYNIAKAVVEPMLVNNYDLVSSVTQQVQTSMNKSAGLGVKAIKPELNQDRIDGFINSVSTADDFDSVKWVLAEPVVVFTQNIVTEAIKANAEFQYKAGLTPKIIRKTTGKCCDWCKEVSGTYEYPDVPKDVYRRHDFCRCKVDYIIGKYRENVHNNNTGKRRYVKDEYGNYVKSKEARVARAKEMEATEKERKEAARAKRIATWEKKKTATTIANTVESSRIKSIDIDDFEMATYGKNISKDAESVILNTIKKAEKKGELFISEVAVKPIVATGRGIPALQIEPTSFGTLKLNINENVFAGKTLEEIDNIFAESILSVANTLEEAVKHECGHAKLIKGLNVEEIDKLYKELEQIHIKGISVTAFNDGVECVAEVEVLLFRGDKVPKEALELYHKYIKGD